MADPFRAELADATEGLSRFVDHFRGIFLFTAYTFLFFGGMCVLMVPAADGIGNAIGCLIAAVVFGGPGWLLLRALDARKRRRKRLATEGTPIEARIVEVSISGNVTVNDQCPWVVIAEADGRRFVSGYLFGNPSQVYKPGDPVTVVVLPDDPGTFEMKLEKLGV